MSTRMEVSVFTPPVRLEFDTTNAGRIYMPLHGYKVENWNPVAATTAVAAVYAASVVTDVILDRHDLMVERREQFHHHRKGHHD